MVEDTRNGGEDRDEGGRGDGAGKQQRQLRFQPLRAPLVRASITPDLPRYPRNSSFFESGACAQREARVRGAAQRAAHASSGGGASQTPRPRSGRGRHTHLEPVSHGNGKGALCYAGAFCLALQVWPA